MPEGLHAVLVLSMCERLEAALCTCASAVRTALCSKKDLSLCVDECASHARWKCGLKWNHTDTQAPCFNFWFALRLFPLAAESHGGNGHHLHRHGERQQGGRSVKSALKEEAQLSGKDVSPLPYNACRDYLQAQELLQPHAGNWSKKVVMGEEEGVGVNLLPNKNESHHTNPTLHPCTIIAKLAAFLTYSLIIIWYVPALAQTTIGWSHPCLQHALYNDLPHCYPFSHAGKCGDV